MEPTGENDVARHVAAGHWWREARAAFATGDVVAD